MEAKTILLGAGEKMLAQRLCEVLNEALLPAAQTKK